MAQKKMHCALQRDQSKIKVAADREKGSLSKNSNRKSNIGELLEGKEISPVTEEGCDHRCLTFFSYEPDGQCHVFLLPIPCRNHSNLTSRENVNMNSLYIVPSPAISSFMVEQQNAQKRNHDASSVKSYAARSLSGSDEQNHLGNNVLESNDIKTTELSGKSCKNSMACNDLSDFLPKNSAFGISSDASKAKKVVRKNSKKKGKKKGKHNKKLPPRFVSARSDVFSEELANNGSSSSEVCAKNDEDVSDEQASCASSRIISVPEFMDDLNDSKENARTTVNCSDVVKHTQCKEIRSNDYACSKAFSDTQDSQVLNSVPVGQTSDDSTDAGLNTTRYSNSSTDLCSTADILNPGVQVSLRGKKGKKVNKVPTNSTCNMLSSGGNSPGRKESNHSVWQKVQKSESNICNYGEKKIESVCSESGITLKEAPKIESVCSESVITLKEAPKIESVCSESGITLKEAPLINNVTVLDLSSNTEDKSFTKVKVSRKLKRKCSAGAKQEVNSGSIKGSHAANAVSKGKVKSHMQQKRKLDIPSLANEEKTPARIPKNDSLNASPRVELCTNKVECVVPEPNVQVCEDNSNHIEEVCDTASSTDVQPNESQRNSFSKSCDLVRESNVPEARSQVYLPHLMCNEVAEAGKEAFYAESSMEDNGSASTLDEEASMGVENSVLSSMCISDNSSVAPSDESSTPRSTVEEDLAPLDVPSKNVGRQTYANPISASAYSQKAVASCVLETDLKKIEEAVNDATRFQLVSEAVQMATGSPIAEFERLLHSASPVISQSHTLRTCQTCSRDQIFGGSLCRHDMPNISLGSLWKWYEKHGSYGLEIMADDYKDITKLDSELYSFRAYFVPYLSAVQLFGSASSNHMGKKEHVQLFATKELNDYELLYEYFESEQPQRRRPLYEKIKELTKGGCVPWQMYGDPSILMSVDMKNLHPRSWYAVAWYPIYRIPDDTFRASFLTYHSLGHFVRRSGARNSRGAGACIVSPVVGLQSYNAQSECWFRPRHPEVRKTVGSHSINPSDILKDRLTALQRTASHMSTASVSKENLISVNTHFDFQFFVSRRN